MEKEAAGHVRLWVNYNNNIRQRIIIITSASAFGRCGSISTLHTVILDTRTHTQTLYFVLAIFKLAIG